MTLFCQLQNKKALLADLGKPLSCPSIWRVWEWESGIGQEFLKAKGTPFSSLRRQSGLSLPAFVARELPVLWSQLPALWAPACLSTGLSYSLLEWILPTHQCGSAYLSPASSFSLSECGIWDLSSLGMMGVTVLS